MVLTDDNFATIVKAVENGRNLYQNIKYAIQFLLSGNFGAILAVLCASLAGLPVPFAPVHLLFINLLTDSLPAIALGVEPHSSEVMNEKPRSADESILTKDFLGKIGLEGLVIGMMTMIGFLTGYNQNGALLGSTYAFGTLCLARLFHGFNCKSDHPVIFTKRFFNNKWLQGAFALGAVLITVVLTVPGFHLLFKVETLDLMQLGCVYLYAFASLPIIQLLKWIRMKLKKERKIVDLSKISIKKLGAYCVYSTSCSCPMEIRCGAQRAKSNMGDYISVCAWRGDRFYNKCANELFGKENFRKSKKRK